MFIKLLFIIFLIISVTGIIAFYFTKRTKILKKQLKETMDEYTDLLNSYSSLEEESRSISRTAADVENLYEITKKMSENLEFDSIFETFNEFLTRVVRFKECKLLLIGKEEGQLYVEKAYKMHHPFEFSDTNVRVANPELKDEIVLDLFYEDQRPIFLSNTNDAERLYRFYPKEDIKTLATNPLIVEDELIGILVVEDMTEKDFEKFLILSGQFALEIKKVKLYETIQELAIIDGLTDVYMRRHFLERVEEEIRRSEHHKHNISFLMIDIDHFKICNDRYGHLVGDTVLSQLAGILKKNLREIDIVCRYGGEEFALALPDTSKESALIASERIRETAEEFAFHAYGENPQITISIGISSYPIDGKDINQLIEAADRALYNAKHTGRNKVCAA